MSVSSVGKSAMHGDVSPSRSGLQSIFYPRTVAVVGANATPGTVPYDIFHNLLISGYRGTLYPVAPGKASICAVKAYRYVLDIPDKIDLAVIVFPAEVVDRAMEQCAKQGVKAAIVISAGFREAGPEGQQREQRIKAICAEHGIALIGPNCLGVINTDPAVRLNASFARKMPDAGRIGFLSQSGALCTAVLDYARDKGIGFSKFVSFGNKAGVSEIDLIEYLHDDPATDVILLYLEEITDGRRLVETARRVTRGPKAKPILAIKAGRTAEGAGAAASHTGSLAGEDAVCDDVFRDAGIVRVASIEELFNTAIMYAYQPMPPGDRLAIVTNAGGPGVMATDAAVRCGLSIARFEPQTTQKLKAALPATANIKNPVDVIGDARADRYAAALDAVLADPNVDQVLVILTPQSMTDIDAIARCVCDVSRRASKAIACSFMGAADVASGVHILQAAHIPHYILPEWACRAMADVQRIRRWREYQLHEPHRPQVDRQAAEALVAACPNGYMREDQALALLKTYGLPVPEYRLCTDAEQAVDFAAQIGYPVVLRAAGRNIVHKSEIGGVALNLRDAHQVREAFADMTRRLAAAPAAALEGVLVRAMIPAGTELILGARHDPSFGPVVMFGLGGIYVELFRDVAFALAPLDAHTAAALVRRVRAVRLLEGARGLPPADIPAVEDSLVRLSWLAADFPRISELDVNPLIAGPAKTGNAVADVRIRLGR